eukprot:TRINITY_DN16505_c0_g1_i2.p1 TRINITY_DN16505_c0_g1~~TRINITY_DN16505_c0_g1_i2.p1  ORF type:complete len:100 (-),score=37.24 TRINITY_DN16505_c0_g1_i2:31-306(-)
MPEFDRPNNVMYEVVFEEAKRSKKAKQMQAASVCNLTDIQKKLQDAEERRRNLELEQLALLEEKKVNAEKVRASRIANGGQDPTMEEDNMF